MKPLSQHIQEKLNTESLKESFIKNLVEEELDALTRIAPAEKVKENTSSLADASVSEK